MEAAIPRTSDVFKALLRADYTTQWRNRRSSVLTLIVPVVILISWKDIIDKIGPEFALSSVITVGLMAIGLMGYSNSIARDREKGVFQRLRVAPIPSASIMISRLTVQLTMVLMVTLLVFIVGYYFDHIVISPAGYLLTIVAALIGGAVYLSLGQAIVGMITNPETVNSTTRLVYFIFIMVGMLGEFGVLGAQLGEIIHWSPYGAVRIILSHSLKQDMDHNFVMALLATLSYAAIFATLGIQKFKWSTR